MSAAQPAYGVFWDLGFGCALGFLFSYVLYHCQIFCFSLHAGESILRLRLLGGSSAHVSVPSWRVARALHTDMAWLVKWWCKILHAGLLIAFCPYRSAIVKQSRVSMVVSSWLMRQYLDHQVQGKAWLFVEMRRSRNSAYNTSREVPSQSNVGKRM